MSLFWDQARHEPRRPAARIEEPSQPWTTTRCHRLLRPLISRIASLRKDTAVTSQSKASTLRSTSGTGLASSAGSQGYHQEPDAESGCLMHRRKRPRLTYSQRRGGRLPQPDGTTPNYPGQDNPGEDTRLAPGIKSGVKKAFKSIQPDGQRRATTPGEIVASTPMLRRARGKIVLSPAAPVPELDFGSNQAGPDRDRGYRTGTSCGAQRRLDERLACLRESMPSRYADLEAIYRSFEALLKATTTNTVHTRGPRSFLDTCLRTVPWYITELEAWERLDAEQSGTVSTLDDINTSARVYNELESLGTNVGWRHLRVVVRADGANAVKQGIEQDLFGDEFSQLIIDLCIQLGAASEAEDLIAALINRQYPHPSSTDSGFTQTTALRPLVTLNYFADQTQRAPFLFRQYSILLSRGNLPPGWLATSELEPVWSSAVRALAGTDPCYDAMSFIAHSILLLSCRKHTFNGGVDTIQTGQDMAKATQRTLMSALAILASMALLGEAEIGAPWLQELDTQRIVVIGDRLRYILRTCIQELGSYTHGRSNQRLDFLYLSLFLSSKQSQNGNIGMRVRGTIGKLSPPSVAPLSSKDIRTRNHYDSITWLIASIARACGRGTSVASHQCLDGLFRQLESLEIAGHLLDNLKVAAAFSVAQQTNNVRDLIYAEGLHPYDRSSSDATSCEQSDRTLFTGYRWEETIGEWVMVSPVVNKRRSILKKHLRSSTPVEGTGGLITGSTNSTTPSIDSISDMSTELDHGTDDGNSTDDRTGRICGGQGTGMMKKRPRRLRSTEALSLTLATKTLVARQDPIIPASSGFPGSQVDPEKENRVRLLAKKPRRSSGRIVLGARSLSRDSIGRCHTYSRDGAISDDELCV